MKKGIEKATEMVEYYKSYLEFRDRYAQEREIQKIQGMGHLHLKGIEISVHAHTHTLLKREINNNLAWIFRYKPT